MTFLQPLLRDPRRTWMLASHTGGMIAPRLEAALDSASRRRGLLGRERWTDSALVLAPCNAVHTLFMRFAIDVLFVDRAGSIVRMRRAVPPWRIALAWRGFATIELPAGTIDRTGLREGDRLAITPAVPA